MNLLQEEECIDDVDNISVEDAVDADSVGGVGTSHDDLGQDDEEVRHSNMLLVLPANYHI